MLSFDEFVDYCEEYLDEFPQDVIADLEFVYLEHESELPKDLRNDNEKFDTITFGFFSTYFSPTVYMCYYAFVEAVKQGMFREESVPKQVERTLLHEIRHYVEYKIGKPKMAEFESERKFQWEQKLLNKQKKKREQGAGNSKKRN